MSFFSSCFYCIYFEDTRIQPWPQLPPKPNILFCKVNGTGGDRYDNLICSMGQDMFLSEEAFEKLYARLATWIDLNNLNGFSVVSCHMFKGNTAGRIAFDLIFCPLFFTHKDDTVDISPNWCNMGPGALPSPSSCRNITTSLADRGALMALYGRLIP